MLIRVNVTQDRARALMRQFEDAPLAQLMTALHLSPVNAKYTPDTLRVYAEDGPTSGVFELRHDGDTARFSMSADDNEGVVAATAFRAMLANTGHVVEVCQ